MHVRGLALRGVVGLQHYGSAVVTVDHLSRSSHIQRGLQLSVFSRTVSPCQSITNALLLPKYGIWYVLKLRALRDEAQ